VQKGEYQYCSKWLQVLWLMLLAFVLLSCERPQHHHQQLTLRQRSVLPERQSIATVNNNEIDLEQFNRVFRWHAEGIAELSQPSRTEIENALNAKRLIASQLIDKYLLEKEAARLGIKITEEDIQKSRQKIVDSFPDATMYNKYIAELPGGEENLRYMLQMILLREKIAAAISATDNVTAMVIDLRSKADIQNHLAQRYQSLTAHSLAKRRIAVGNRRPLGLKAKPVNKSVKTL